MNQTTNARKLNMRKSIHGVVPLVATAGLGVLATMLWKQRRRSLSTDLTGQVALITGASRGLGLLLAHEFARAGCRLAICARDAQELEWAQAELQKAGAEVVAIACDVADQSQVNHLVREAMLHYGRVDILVNNAGIIDVGPLENSTLADFERALDVMYWGTLYTIWAVLPQMRARRQGRIVNITSIGGKVSIPHLLPYTSAKFATVGLSEGLHAELAQEGIQVTTIVPGLMRTGSHLNALFKGKQQEEFTWFSLGASLPFISMSAERAAQQIVEATRRGDSTRVLSLPAILLAYLHGLAPGLTSELLGFINQWLLPDAAPANHTVQQGLAVQESLPPFRAQLQKTLTSLGREAAERLHQLPNNGS